MFLIYKCYGDSRNHVPSGSEVPHIGAVKTDNSLFQSESEANNSSIVISSFSTWATRHGPSPQRKWEKNNSILSSGNEPNANWDRQMHQLFEIVVADEALSLKDMKS